MSVFNFLFMALPVIFLVGSVLLAVKAVSRGKSKKTALLMQLAAFAFVFAVCMICPFAVSAAEEATSVAKDGMVYIGAAAATGLSCIGGGIAVGNAAPAAIGATSEDPKAFGKAIIFVALGEGIALYGMLISIMILNG